MHNVIKEDLAVSKESLASEERLLPKSQIPSFFPSVISCVLQGNTRSRNIFVECVEQSIHLKWSPRLVRFSAEIEGWRGQYSFSEYGEVRQMTRQLVERHRFLVWSIALFIEGNTLEHGACYFHLLLKLW